MISEFEKEQQEMIEKEVTCRSKRIVGDTIFNCIKPFYHNGRHVSNTGRIW
jgi:hypothetical protein